MNEYEWANYYLPDKWGSLGACYAAARDGDTNAADDILAVFDCLLSDYSSGVDRRTMRLAMVELLFQGFKGGN